LGKSIAKKSLTRKSKATVSHSNYAKFIATLNKKTRTSQLKAAISVNRKMIRLYWDIGKDIVGKQEQDGWWSKVIERVAKDIQL